MESLLTFEGFTLAAAVTVALKLLLVVVFFLTVPLGVGYIEHKGLAHMQARLGPMEAGPHGVLQLVADGIKFLQKEDIVPSRADKWVYTLAPAVAMLPAMFILVTIPLGPGLWAEDLSTGVFYALAVSSISTIGVLMGAWSSANKFSLMGGLRAAAQLISYELPLVLGAVAVVLQAGTLSLVGIVEAQNSFEIFGLFPMWYFVPHIVGLALFYVAALAELNRPPFDMPIADSELIFGHMTEYTGLRYAFFMLTEYAGMVVLSALATVLFLGGWYPWPGFDFSVVPGGEVGAAILGFVVTVTKIVILCAVMVWLRATFPRLREDQLQRLSWLILIPIGLLNVTVIAIAKVWFS